MVTDMCEKMEREFSDELISKAVEGMYNIISYDDITRKISPEEYTEKLFNEMVKSYDTKSI
jgi:hypothetical protein